MEEEEIRGEEESKWERELTTREELVRSAPRVCCSPASGVKEADVRMRMRWAREGLVPRRMKLSARFGGTNRDSVLVILFF
jgi:hypothetical protein